MHRFRFRVRFAEYVGSFLGFVLAGVTDHRLVREEVLAVPIGYSGVGRGGASLRLKVNSHATRPRQTTRHKVTFRAHVIMLVFGSAQRGLPQTPILIMHAGGG